MVSPGGYLYMYIYTKYMYVYIYLYIHMYIFKNCNIKVTAEEPDLFGEDTKLKDKLKQTIGQR